MVNGVKIRGEFRRKGVVRKSGSTPSASTATLLYIEITNQLTVISTMYLEENGNNSTPHKIYITFTK